MKRTIRSFFSQYIHEHNVVSVVTGVVILLTAVIVWGEFNRIRLQAEIKSQSKVYSEKFAELASSTLETKIFIEDLHNRLTNVIQENALLNTVVLNEQVRNESIQEQVGKVASTIGSLDKLSKTDPQLLQKYSKVYFLNEHYAPSELAKINPEFTFNKEVTYEIHAKIAPRLNLMLGAAKAEGKDLLVISAYRSYGSQSALKSAYKVTYGAGTANQFSAEQGFSEHQLGTTVDFTTSKTGSNFNAFETTPEFTWLKDNAYKFGFVLSYPKGNKYYVYEPWHWRYVGIDLAARLKREGLYFYDLDQRTIDNYLLLFFE